MTSIAIIGSNSFIGNSLVHWLSRWPDEYYIKILSARNNDLTLLDFKGIDKIVYLAALVHVNEDNHEYSEYYEINARLAYDIVRLAKEAGVKQCVFMSTMSVFGQKEGEISSLSLVNPITKYGRSKHEGEKLILALSDANFVVAIIRAPLVYGPGCKGNFDILQNIARRLPIFPSIVNRRSMLFVDNLSQLIRIILDNNSEGYFYPQNKEYVSTSSVVRAIAEVLGKKMYFTTLFNPLIKLVVNKYYGKIFGNLTYSQEMSRIDYDYETCNFYESIEKTMIGDKS